mmetsp:Transcript_82366/g.245662  ORF Transcript_82366/g.245662 Transcript_82366/m.245662 type:complete len:217 (-) Transcript_82366:392-1042(-)
MLVSSVARSSRVRENSVALKSDHVAPETALTRSSRGTSSEPGRGMPSAHLTSNSAVRCRTDAKAAMACTVASAPRQTIATVQPISMRWRTVFAKRRCVCSSALGPGVHAKNSSPAAACAVRSALACTTTRRLCSSPCSRLPAEHFSGAPPSSLGTVAKALRTPATACSESAYACKVTDSPARKSIANFRANCKLWVFLLTKKPLEVSHTKSFHAQP